MMRKYLAAICFGLLFVGFTFRAKAADVTCPCNALRPPSADFVAYVDTTVGSPVVNASSGGGGDDPCSRIVDCDSCQACCYEKYQEDKQTCRLLGCGVASAACLQQALEKSIYCSTACGVDYNC
jgi:hypothetical protein